MEELPDSIDLPALGLDPSEVKSVALLGRHEGHTLCRVVCGGRSFVLKWFASGAENIEVQAYALLSRYGVPTLRVHGSTDDALLLEDLDASPTWRLATAADNSRAQTGTAVAEWYRALHAAGRALLANDQAAPGYLRREVDSLDIAVILWMGERLGPVGSGVWKLAAEYIEALKSAIRTLPTTLNYNDFEWTNLALSRQETPSLRAIVFDYHLLGIGPAYSDYRNVMGSLEGRAREAFQDAFGPVDEREALLDAPTSVLYGLYEALQRPRLPGWATGPLAEVASGELEQKLQRAIAVIK